MVLLWILSFALLGSVGAVGAAALVLLFPTGLRQTLVPYLLSYATGTLLATALLGLLPHAIEHLEAGPSLAAVLAGLLLFFVLERLLMWRHCHAEGPCPAHPASGYLILLGDALHNFVDGVVIAAAFLTSMALGITTALAVMAHEVPQEVGDFAVLLDDEHTRERALAWNMLSGSATLPGALLAYGALERLAGATPYVMALAAASFLYVGLADLIPGLQAPIGGRAGIGQCLLVLLGVGTILVLRWGHG